MRYLIAIHLIACGKAAESLDCEAYAQHATDLDDPAPGRRDSILEVERRACTSGRISKTVVECVNAASSGDELLACNGLGKKKTPPPVARPTPDAAPAKGTSHVTLVGVRNAGNFHPIAPEGSRPADQQAWLDRIAKSIAACETEDTYVPRQTAVLVTFSPQAPTFMFDVSPMLGSCVKLAITSERQPASVGNGPADFLIDLGK